MKAATLLLLAACATSSHVELPLWLDLKPGPYAVGYRSGVWYPSRAEGEHLRYRDYLDTLDEVEAALHKQGIGPDAVVALFDSPMHARRDSPALGSFPLVVIALGQAESHVHQVVLAEYLASHGYEVTLGTADRSDATVIGPSFGGAGLRAMAERVLLFLRRSP